MIFNGEVIDGQAVIDTPRPAEADQDVAREQFLLAAIAGEVLTRECCDAQGWKYEAVEVAPMSPPASN